MNNKPYLSKQINDLTDDWLTPCDYLPYIDALLGDIDLDPEMYKQIEDYAYDVIENNVCADGYDWYNGDGGWGNLHIYPATKEIKIEYHQKALL